jgi:hypothetical protein
MTFSDKNTEVHRDQPIFACLYLTSNEFQKLIDGIAGSSDQVSSVKLFVASAGAWNVGRAASVIRERSIYLKINTFHNLLDNLPIVLARHQDSR